MVRKVIFEIYDVTKWKKTQNWNTLFADPFLKNQNWAISISFVCQDEDYRNILKLSCSSLVFTIGDLPLSQNNVTQTYFPSPSKQLNCLNSKIKNGKYFQN